VPDKSNNKNSIPLLECLPTAVVFYRQAIKYVIKYKETIQFNTIRFSSLFIYVTNSIANGQLQSQHENKPHQQHDNNGGGGTIKTEKIYQFRLLTLEYEVLKTAVCLQSAFAVETHLVEGH
jgi:hypothetical protein